VFGLIEDIQKNKEEKKDLKVSKEQLESVAQNLPGILYTFFMKPCGEVGFSYMTEKAQEIYGFRADEIIANPSITFENIHPNDLPDLNLAIADSAKNMTEFQWMGRVLNGSKTKWIKAVSTPYKKSNGMIEWRGIMLDVTKEKEREELIEFHQAQLFASRKFSDLGEVAGGIAHEINTPLATLGLSIDHIENLKKRNQLNEIHLTKTLDSMRRVVDRLARIVDTIRNFSRDKVGEPMVHTTWNELTQEALNLVREKLKQLDIDVDLDIDESLIINCRYNQTLQAFLNLVKNSIDALEKDNNYPKSISIRTSSNPQNVYLEVVDSGPGVPGKIKDRVFDSFFTTKSYGRGTGLGLSLSREFIESSGGQLELHKQNKRYNCFRISFPSVLFQEVS
jgi:C4-dicarboxylate-specific signal transduction histidine kinase